MLGSVGLKNVWIIGLNGSFHGGLVFSSTLRAPREVDLVSFKALLAAGGGRKEILSFPTLNREADGPGEGSVCRSHCCLLIFLGRPPPLWLERIETEASKLHYLAAWEDSVSRGCGKKKKYERKVRFFSVTKGSNSVFSEVKDDMNFECLIEEY